MIYNILSITTSLLSFFLGIYVYQSDRNNKINKTFVLFILSTILWIFANFMTDISVATDSILFWSEFALIGPILIAYAFYRLSIFFPKTKPTVKWLEIVILALTLAFLVLSFTKFNISSVYLLQNDIPAIKPGPLYPFFLVYFVGLFSLGIKNLFKGYKLYSHLEKLQVQYLTLGLIVSGALGLIVDVVLPLFGNSNYVNLGPYFILIFIFLTSYSIIKFKMFDIKIVATELLVFSLWTFVLVRILLSNSTEDQVVNGGLLALLIIVGIFLIKSVIKEVTQRERIEKLAGDLQKANDRLTELDKQKSEFVSFATHQLRAPLTAMKGYASLILEGDLGDLSKQIKQAIGRIYDSSTTLTNIVDDYLNISRIELGTMKYAFETIDLKNLVENVIGELKPNIEKSKLTFSFNVDPQKKYMVNIDKDKFKQIIANLIDNSMKYTPSGSVNVFLEKKAGADGQKIVFSVKDTGIGIAEGVMPKLFAKFSRAENGTRQNIHGTGLGLFVAKEIVMAHKGKIWAESAGEGKGSAFFVELEEVI